MNPLPANVDETPTPWEFSVEGETGSEDVHDHRKVALWLGHASVQTTEIYLRSDPQEKLEAIEAIVPSSLRRGRFKAPDQLLAVLHAKTLPAPAGGATLDTCVGLLKGT